MDAPLTPLPARDPLDVLAAAAEEAETEFDADLGVDFHPAAREALERALFTLEDTGGGCTAYVRRAADGRALVLVHAFGPCFALTPSAAVVAHLYAPGAWGAGLVEVERADAYATLVAALVAVGDGGMS